MVDLKRDVRGLRLLEGFRLHLNARAYTFRKNAGSTQQRNKTGGQNKVGDSRSHITVGGSLVRVSMVCVTTVSPEICAPSHDSPPRPIHFCLGDTRRKRNTLRFSRKIDISVLRFFFLYPESTYMLTY